METSLLSWVLLPVVCLITGEVVCHGNAQLVQCKESDRQALVDFRKGLENSENRLSSWRGSSCCQWWGIACDNGTGDVITVDLHNPYPSGYDSSGRYGFWNLGGEIRSSLTKLKSLRHLDLSFNTFSGKIPDFFSSLEKLQYLNLANSGFSGYIPPSFRNLSSLQFLDVSSTFPVLTVDNLEWVTGLVPLRYLVMSGTNLSMVGVGWVEALNKLPLLTELHLPACGLNSFTSSLTFLNFTSLAVVDLSGNSFNSELLNWLSNISSLVSVYIGSSGLYGRIPLGFSELPNLQTLKLDNNNNLTASCSHLLGGSWAKIEVLDLSMNKLLGRLPASLGNLTSLIHLDFFHNSVEGGIPSSFGKLCNLDYIDLSGNNLTGSLPEFLEETEDCPSELPLPRLQNLVASNNQLIGNLPDWLGQLKNLIILNLQWNMLQGPIPPSIGDLPYLSELRLEANKLNGTLPESLGQLSELTALDVSINQLTGVISEAHFSKLSRLTYLILSANSFTLNVSSNWIPPFQVLFLDMGSCRLGPSFPAWLRSQKQINFVDFSNASISGSIPSWLWSMSSNLSLLNVSYNFLEGHLPNSFNVSPSALIDLSSNLFEGPIPVPSVGVNLFDLSNNKFSGPIPNDIGKLMPNLVFLSLSGNNLSGGIPASMGELLSIEVVDLSRNNLTGNIPVSIGNCSSLSVLDLQNNNLSGMISRSLGQLNLLQSLHLSGNKFTGEIPLTLQNLSNLETLDLANNILTGNIPPWIGDGFAHLRILSLRSNNLSGEIPSAISNLSSLQILDLAENELNGTVPASLSHLKAMTQVQQQNSNPYLLYGTYMTQYYQENLVVNMRVYTKILSLVNSIDLSRNNLHGELPEEMTKLAGLEMLNLSRNSMRGQIPESISELHELLSLDLSGNMLSGPIPPSMATMTFLGHLNFSNNNLSGEIPRTNQMATFDASAFAGNPGLCGAPLTVNCPGDDANDGGTNDGSIKEGRIDGDSGHGFVDKWFSLSIGLGYAAGLLLPYIAFAIKRS